MARFSRCSLICGFLLGFSFASISSCLLAHWLWNRRKQRKRTSALSPPFLDGMELIDGFRFRYSNPCLISQIGRIPYDDPLYPDTSIVWSLEENDFGDLILVKNNLLRMEPTSQYRFPYPNARDRRNMAICLFRNYLLIIVRESRTVLVCNLRNRRVSYYKIIFSDDDTPLPSDVPRYLFATGSVVCLVSLPSIEQMVDV